MAASNIVRFYAVALTGTFLSKVTPLLLVVCLCLCVCVWVEAQG